MALRQGLLLTQKLAHVAQAGLTTRLPAPPFLLANVVHVYACEPNLTFCSGDGNSNSVLSVSKQSLLPTEPLSQPLIFFFMLVA